MVFNTKLIVAILQEEKMENFILWNCAKESYVFILNLTFQRLNIACD